MAIDFSRLKLRTKEERDADQRKWEEEQARKRQELSRMLTDLVNLESGLTKFELDFVESHATNREGWGEDLWFERLTENMRKKLRQIHEERVE